MSFFDDMIKGVRSILGGGNNNSAPKPAPTAAASNAVGSAVRNAVSATPSVGFDDEAARQRAEAERRAREEEERRKREEERRRQEEERARQEAARKAEEARRLQAEKARQMLGSAAKSAGGSMLDMMNKAKEDQAQKINAAKQAKFGDYNNSVMDSLQKDFDQYKDGGRKSFEFGKDITESTRDKAFLQGSGNDMVARYNAKDGAEQAKTRRQLQDLADKYEKAGEIEKLQNVKRVQSLFDPNRNKAVQQKEEPNFGDYLNPFGEHGLFGVKQQKTFKNTAGKHVVDPIKGEFKKFEQHIDSGDQKQGFQWDDLGDYGRFAAKLPTGMVSGVLDAPEKVAQAMSGKEVAESGEVKDLNGLQRAGRLGDAYLSTAGIASGASGKLLNTLGKGAAGQITKEAGKEVAKTGFKELVKGGLKNVASEGAEEFAQNIFEQVGKTGDLSKIDMNQAIESAKMGALGGGMMGGANFGVRNALNGGADFKAAGQDVKNAFSKNTENGDVNISKLHPDQMGFNKDEVIGKITGDTRKRMSERAFKTLQEQRENNPYTTADGQDLMLSRVGNSKITSTRASIPDDVFGAKMRTTPRMKEILANSEKSHSSPDTKNHKIAPDGFEYYDSNVRISGKDYAQGFDVGINKETGRNTVYNSILKEEPPFLGFDAESNVGSSIDSISQDAQNVKMKKGIVKNLITNQQKTRKFAERAAMLDDAPENLIKTLEEGGMDYDIKKNADLASAAEQNVSTAPEQVYNKIHQDGNLSDQDFADGIALAEKYKSEGNSAEAGLVYMKLAEKATEAGRSVQALSLLKKTTPEGAELSINREIQKYNEKMRKKNQPHKQVFIEGWNDAELDNVLKNNPKMAGKVKRVSKLEYSEFSQELKDAYAMPAETDAQNRQRIIAISRAAEMMTSKIPNTMLEKAFALRRANLLSGIPTHLRNISGNVINAAAEKGSNLTGAIYDKALSGITGQRSVVASGMGGTGKGLVKGLKDAKDILIDGVDTTQDGSRWIENRKVNFGDGLAGKALSGYTNFVMDLTQAGDKPFRAMAYENSIDNQARVAAVNNGLKGEEKANFIKEFKENPPIHAQEIANHDADMATFQQDTALGDMAQKMANSKAGVAVEIAAPFRKTPSAVADQFLNYSPVGFMKGVKKTLDLKKAVKNGASEVEIQKLQRDAAQMFGRSTVGAIAGAATIGLAQQGLITGQPKDEKERIKWEAEGKKPNSLNIFGVYIPLDGISPQTMIATAYANGVDLMESGKNMFDGSLQVIGQGMKSWSEQGYMTGVSDAIDTLRGDKDLAKYLASQGSGFVIPSFIKRVAAAQDEYARETATALDSVVSGIPGLRQTLPVKHDIYGREVKTDPVATMFDPFRMSKDKKHEISDKLDQIRAGNSDYNSVIPQKAPNKVTIDGQTRHLTAKEESEYQKLMGSKAAEYMNNFINSEKFATMSADDRVNALEKIKKDVRSATEQVLFGKNSKNASENSREIAKEMAGGKGDLDFSSNKDKKKETKKRHYAQSDAEYNDFKAEFDEKSKKGEYTRLEKLSAQKKLKKLEVIKSFDKENRDIYGKSDSKLTEIYGLFDDQKGKETVRGQLNAINDKLLENGLIDQKTYDKRYKNINEIASGRVKGVRRSKRGGSGRASETFDAPTLSSFKVGSAPKIARTTDKGKGIVKGLKVNSENSTVSVKEFSRARVTRR